MKHATSFTVDGTRYDVQNPKRTEAIGEMKSSKWVAYALYSLGVRFYELAKKADSLDILLVLCGYILMHVTFLRLFFGRSGNASSISSSARISEGSGVD